MQPCAKGVGGEALHDGGEHVRIDARRELSFRLRVADVLLEPAPKAEMIARHDARPRRGIELAQRTTYRRGRHPLHPAGDRGKGQLQDLCRWEASGDRVADVGVHCRRGAPTQLEENVLLVREVEIESALGDPRGVAISATVVSSTPRSNPRTVQRSIAAVTSA